MQNIKSVTAIQVDDGECIETKGWAGQKNRYTLAVELMKFILCIKSILESIEGMKIEITDSARFCHDTWFREKRIALRVFSFVPEVFCKYDFKGAWRAAFLVDKQ